MSSSKGGRTCRTVAGSKVIDPGAGDGDGDAPGVTLGVGGSCVGSGVGAAVAGSNVGELVASVDAREATDAEGGVGLDGAVLGAYVPIDGSGVEAEELQAATMATSRNAPSRRITPR
jgi:hypothetical protein